MPIVIRKIGTYRAFLLACGLMLMSAIFLSSEDITYFSVGLFLHVFSIAASEVSLTLYVLVRINRSEMTRFEPLRILSTVLALTIGPFLGVYLKVKVFHEVPFIVCGVFVVLALVYFRFLIYIVLMFQDRNRQVLIHYIT